MIVETGLGAKAVIAGGGIVSGIALLAGMAGGAKVAETSGDPAKLAASLCSSAPTSKVTAVTDLSREQVANARIIVDTATALGLPQRAAVIGVATALQESGLKNDVVGDHGTSFGLFQQRPVSGWGTKAEVTDPRYAARAFFSRLVKVHNWQAMPLAKAASIVQRPREDLRGEYAKHEPLAEKVVAQIRGAQPAADGTRGLSVQELQDVRVSIQAAASLGLPRDVIVAEVGTRLRRDLTDRTESERRAEEIVSAVQEQLCSDLTSQLSEVSVDVDLGAGRGAIAVRAALGMRGVPYSWGGGGPTGPSYGIGRGAGTRGFDCSGLAEYAWSKAGVRIGGHTSVQWTSGVHVPRSQIKPGDLLFFATNPQDPSTIHHVGIALNGTRMVHAPSTGSTVRVDIWVGDPYREREFVGAVRPG
ncbi:C40 family peptidase [Microbispora sp. NPDC049125]|uniref:C40 family peptidase n=1 Tax=Microbispora sp. NPDC049125 TaxID=3154929 RepID=UPI003466B593